MSGMFDSCIPDCPLCDGVGWVNTHAEDCECDACNGAGDVRDTMGPCPNREALIVDISEPWEVAYAEKHGYTVPAEES